MRSAWVLIALAACSYPDLPALDVDGGSDADGGGVDDAFDPDGSGENALVSLAFRAADNPMLAADVVATIDGATIFARVPLGANRSLIATFETTGARIELDGVVQESGVTANTFLGPRIYRVLAENGASMDYAVTVASPGDHDAYVKPSNRGLAFGRAIALSADGRTLAIGASGERSAATGIGGSQTDMSASGAGAVYVFARTGTSWTQQAYVKASNTQEYDGFGGTVALSADGDTLAVGATGEDSIGANQADNTANDAGAVYVFRRSGAVWAQEAYVKASNPDAGDYFGTQVALSGDGATLVVGAPNEDSATLGINGNQASDAAMEAGAVYVYTRSGTAWSQQAYLKASNTDAGDELGRAVAISADGNTIAAGAHREDSIATGIDGNDQSDTKQDTGAVYVFVRAGSGWTQQAYVKASTNHASFTSFGTSVALAGDGNTLVTGAIWENSNATGVGGDQLNSAASGSGAVYVFVRTNATWAQQAYVKATNTDLNDHFGYRIALSGSGDVLAVGAEDEDSFANGIDGDAADDTAPETGAAYLYTRLGTTWSPHAYVKASNPNQGDRFGNAVALAADGSLLAVGAGSEDSAATGIHGNQADNSDPGRGAVYTYR